MSSRISRRALLRGAGAAVALPLLEAMEARGADPAPPVRLMFVYKPGGFVMPEWTFSSTLAPLQALRGDVLVLGGLDARNGETGGNGHPLACSPWLSSAPVGKKDRGGYATDVTVDQIAAAKIGESTRLRSLELGINQSRADIHYGNISWRGPASPMGKEVSPRAVFSRLFGDPRGDTYRRSILDLVLEDARGLEKRLGVEDREKVAEYLDSIRSIEKRIQAVERSNPPPPPEVAVPDSVPRSAAEHIGLLASLVALGFQADSTRVVTWMLENEDMIPPMPELGIRDSHHSLVHNDSRPGRPIGSRATQEKVDKLKIFDRFYVEQFAGLLGKLKGIREGAGTLLDHSLVLFGSGLSWGNLHVRTDLPLVLAGRGGGTVKPGRALRYPAGTPFASLHLSLLERVGVRLDRIADSKGPLPDLG